MNLVNTLSHGIGLLATESGVNNGPGAWMPELRGILTVIIGVFVLMGSVYFILLTNMGARLAFLVSFSALAGWFFLMGAIWWIYGIGLKGPEPSWDPVPGRTVIQAPEALLTAEVLDSPIEVLADPVQTAEAVQDQFVEEGWAQLPPEAAAYGQAASAAETYLIDSGAFAGGDYRVMNVFDIGGERYPRLADGKVDFLAFWHKPRHIVVEVAPVIPVRDEPGRAPAQAQVDESQPHQYVYMVRNKGAKRQPAGFITVGSLIVFLVSAWLLHRRDKIVIANRSLPALPSKA
ncbi:MAG: hypothetical protein KDB40_14150 [Acidimicrobiales bacterium]|nr:hypothetical protein [Acidimicrobiales bacterium]MCB9392071.1 hypothetical protein [Acidimicrobiaceae bacterium]